MHSCSADIMFFVIMAAMTSALCLPVGSSVHVDLAFLRQHMPRLAEHLPYRVVVCPVPCKNSTVLRLVPPACNAGTAAALTTAWQLQWHAWILHAFS